MDDETPTSSNASLTETEGGSFGDNISITSSLDQEDDQGSSNPGTDEDDEGDEDEDSDKEEEEDYDGEVGSLSTLEEEEGSTQSSSSSQLTNSLTQQSSITAASLGDDDEEEEETSMTTASQEEDNDDNGDGDSDETSTNTDTKDTGIDAQDSQESSTSNPTTTNQVPEIVSSLHPISSSPPPPTINAPILEPPAPAVSPKSRPRTDSELAIETMTTLDNERRATTLQIKDKLRTLEGHAKDVLEHKHEDEANKKPEKKTELKISPSPTTISPKPKPSKKKSPTKMANLFGLQKHNLAMMMRAKRIAKKVVVKSRGTEHKAYRCRIEIFHKNKWVMTWCVFKSGVLQCFKTKKVKVVNNVGKTAWEWPIGKLIKKLDVIKYEATVSLVPQNVKVRACEMRRKSQVTFPVFLTRFALCRYLHVRCRHHLTPFTSQHLRR